MKEERIRNIELILSFDKMEIKKKIVKRREGNIHYA